MNKAQPILIKSANIHAENNVIENGFLHIEDGKIAGVYREFSAENMEKYHVLDGQGLNLIPGFIDGHIHGANGADVMDGTEEALDTMAGWLPKEGTTSFLATTITQSRENIEKALMNVAQHKSNPGQAEILGIHLEGPFVEKSKAGAQPLQYIIEPDLEMFAKWQQLSGQRIKTITLAPEHDPQGVFINTLNESRVNVSAGHTGVGYAGMKKAVKQGVQQVTHLCNAMTGIHHRDIGVVGAAFQLEELKAELIADGVHVSPEMIELIYENIGSDRLILITDSMRAKGLTPGDYELGGQPVTVTNDRALLSDGTLAGSILKMNDAARQMKQVKNVAFQDIIKMTAENPAKQIRVFNRKGSIVVGKDADLLLVDDHFNIACTICRGTIAYRGEIE